MNTPSITVDLEVNEDGTLNVWVARESSTGLHYYNVTPKKIGELVENEIEDILKGEYAPCYPTDT